MISEKTIYIYIYIFIYVYVYIYIYIYFFLQYTLCISINPPNESHSLTLSALMLFQYYLCTINDLIFLIKLN